MRFRTRPSVHGGDRVAFAYERAWRRWVDRPRQSAGYQVASALLVERDMRDGRACSAGDLLFGFALFGTACADSRD